MLAVLSVTLLAQAGAAYGLGASASATGDPPTGSPAGAVYELPLERGRAEAAPKGGGGTAVSGTDGGGSGAEGEGAGAGGDSGGGQGGGTGGESGAEGSLYRSENNFGSSSHVPGTPPPASADSAAAGDGPASEAAASLAQGRKAAQVADAGNTSPAANIALLGAIALLAVGSAVLIGRARRLDLGH
jgi:hypothetical protein